MLQGCTWHMYYNVIFFTSLIQKRKTVMLQSKSQSLPSIKLKINLPCLVIFLTAYKGPNDYFIAGMFSFHWTPMGRWLNI